MYSIFFIDFILHIANNNVIYVFAARYLAAKLYIIKDLCPLKYLSLCYAIDEIIEKAMKEQNIVLDN